MRTLLTVILAVVGFTLLCGCGRRARIADDFDPRFTYTASDVRRDRLSNVSEAELSELVAGNSDFAFDLYKEISSGSDNLFYSPYSITVALAMVYAGASGQTETEMADTLRYTLPQSTLHGALNALDLDLSTRGQDHEYRREEEPIFRLNIANSIWGRSEHMFLPLYLDNIARNYGTGLRLIDIGGDPENARRVMNDWVEEKTEGRIKGLLTKDVVAESTLLVLINAIYFKARWELPFGERDTREGDFHLIDGTTVSVPMMEFDEPALMFRYTMGDGWQAIDLAYDLDGFQGRPELERGVSMLVLIPDEGRFEEFESLLDNDKVLEIVDDLDYNTVHLFFPKFVIESKILMKDILSRMGMPSAFMGGLAAMDGGVNGLFVRNVVHQAYVSVDEKGTEAAAATAVGVDCIMPGGVELTVDRPFIFLIRDNVTGTILFFGRVMNPAG